MPGQIIIISGTSGSGKSTAAELLAKRSKDFWLLHGIDHFMSATFPAQFGHHGPQSEQGVYADPVDPNDPEGPLRWRFGPKGIEAFAAFHEWLAAASRQGCNIILDHLMMSDPPIIQDIVRRLGGLPVLFVSLKCPYNVLQQRIANRTMDKKMPVDILGEDATRKIIDRLNRLRPWFYEAVYANDIYDLEIDTVANAPEQVVTLIEARRQQGPGTAFEQLARKFSLASV